MHNNEFPIYDQNNAKDLTDRLVKGIGVEIADYQQFYFKKLKTELQVHTMGKLFDKTLTLFSNEDPESAKFVLNSYEAITKGSIWRGIDQLSRIFNNSGFQVIGDAETIAKLNEVNFFSDYVNEFINITTAKDPNSIQVWYKKADGNWESRFVETQFIKVINKHEIAFIVPEESEYKLTREVDSIGRLVNTYDNQGKRIVNSYFEGVKYEFGAKVKYVYINNNQYIEILAKNETAELTFTQFNQPLNSPYTFTGVDKLEEGVYNSPVSSFIPFGNHALIQHRTYRSVEALFGYPRMSEIELPCDHCVGGQEVCDPCDEFPEGVKPCTKCGGSGHYSLQSSFKIYKRKLFPDAPELNANIKPVEFFTPDIGILQYNADAWQKTIALGEDAIYVQRRLATGNVESAEAKEKQMESMYAWLGRISSVIYDNIQKAIDNFSIIHNTGQVSVQQPMSYAIISEMEAFGYLNTIVSTDAPLFIKTTHIENFLNKYISKTSPVIKIVDILKRIDPFVFYSSKDLQTMSDSGVISDMDWRVHNYAFPILNQLYTRNPDLLDQEPDVIERFLMQELDKKTPKQNNFKMAIAENNNAVEEDDDEEELRDEPEMIEGVIEILLDIENPENRKRVLDKQVENWKKEGINYDLEKILAATNLNNV